MKGVYSACSMTSPFFCNPCQASCSNALTTASNRRLKVGILEMVKLKPCNLWTTAFRKIYSGHSYFHMCLLRNYRGWTQSPPFTNRICTWTYTNICMDTCMRARTQYPELDQSRKLKITLLLLIHLYADNFLLWQFMWDFTILLLLHSLCDHYADSWPQYS